MKALILLAVFGVTACADHTVPLPMPQGGWRAANVGMWQPRPNDLTDTPYGEHKPN